MILVVGDRIYLKGVLVATLYPGTDATTKGEFVKAIDLLDPNERQPEKNLDDVPTSRAKARFAFEMNKNSNGHLLDCTLLDQGNYIGKVNEVHYAERIIKAINSVEA